MCFNKWGPWSAQAYQNRKDIKRNLFSTKKTRKILLQFWCQTERKKHNLKNKIPYIQSCFSFFVLSFSLKWNSTNFFQVHSTLQLFVSWRLKERSQMPKSVLTLCLSGPLIYTLDVESNASQPALNKIKKARRDMEWEGKKKRQTGQSWEWGETEHSVCCVYEGRTWHKHWPVCKSILCCSLLHACLLNTVFVLSLCTVTLRIHTATPGPCNALCHTGRGRTDQDNVGQHKIGQDRLEYQIQEFVLNRKIRTLINCSNIDIYSFLISTPLWLYK